MLASVAGGVLAGVVGYAIFGGKSSKKVAGPDTTTSTTAGITPAAQELLDRFQKFKAFQGHASYASATDSSGTKVAVDIWIKGPRTRKDIAVTSADATVVQESLLLPEGNVLCSKSPPRDWVCEKFVSTSSSSSTGGLLESVAGDLHGKQVTTTDEKIGDRDVRCYTIDGSPPSTICLTADGLPVRFSNEGQSLDLQTLDPDVDDSVFTPPAPPTAPSTAPTSVPTSSPSSSSSSSS